MEKMRDLEYEIEQDKEAMKNLENEIEKKRNAMNTCEYSFYIKVRSLIQFLYHTIKSYFILDSIRIYKSLPKTQKSRKI